MPEITKISLTMNQLKGNIDWNGFITDKNVIIMKLRVEY